MAWTKPMPAHPVVAVAGATGAVGREMLKCLEQLDFPASEVRVLASARSAGIFPKNSALFRSAFRLSIIKCTDIRRLTDS